MPVVATPQPKPLIDPFRDDPGAQDRVDDYKGTWAEVMRDHVYYQLPAHEVWKAIHPKSDGNGRPPICFNIKLGRVTCQELFSASPTWRP